MRNITTSDQIRARLRHARRQRNRIRRCWIVLLAEDLPISEELARTMFSKLHRAARAVESLEQSSRLIGVA